MSGIALEIALQTAAFLRNGQFVIRFRKVIHTNIDIACTGQMFDCMLQQREFLIS